MADTDPPVSPDTLERARLRLRKGVPMHGIGPHVRRRAGQSLEFREFREYQMGDDIRLVDWRASLRAGPRGSRLVRVFEAEEKLTLVVVVDARAAMRLPEGAEKLLYALWSLRSLAQVAAGNGDEVVLGTLFSVRDPSPVRARGRGVAAAARRFAEGLWREAPQPLSETPRCNLEALTRCLEPASAVVILSDLLFADADGAVRRFARRAQESWRQVIVQPLDSVGAELSAAERAGSLRVASTEGRAHGDEVFDVTQDFRRDVRARASRQVESHLAGWAGHGLTVEPAVCWPAGADRALLARHFATHFIESGLLRGVAARGGLR